MKINNLSSVFAGKVHGLKFNEPGINITGDTSAIGKAESIAFGGIKKKTSVDVFDKTLFNLKKQNLDRVLHTDKSKDRDVKMQNINRLIYGGVSKGNNVNIARLIHGDKSKNRDVKIQNINRLIRGGDTNISRLIHGDRKSKNFNLIKTAQKLFTKKDQPSVTTKIPTAEEENQAMLEKEYPTVVNKEKRSGVENVLYASGIFKTPEQWTEVEKRKLAKEQNKEILGRVLAEKERDLYKNQMLRNKYPDPYDRYVGRRVRKYTRPFTAAPAQFAQPLGNSIPSQGLLMMSSMPSTGQGLRMMSYVPPSTQGISVMSRLGSGQMPTGLGMLGGFAPQQQEQLQIEQQPQASVPIVRTVPQGQTYSPYSKRAVTYTRGPYQKHSQQY